MVKGRYFLFSISFILLVIVIFIFGTNLSKKNYSKKNIRKSNERISEDLFEAFNLGNHSEFYKQFSEYLSFKDSLDLNNCDTVRFEAKNECYFSPHKKVHFLKDGDYVISENYPSSFVAMYSPEGKFKKRIGRTGNGPGEYSDAGFIDIVNDTIYCYDVGKKIILFSKKGDFIREYRITNRSFFCKDFRICPISKKVIFYNVFLFMKPHIISLLSFNNVDKNLSLLGDFGKMEDVSVVSRGFLIHGLEVNIINSKEYIFALDPQRLGFFIFDSNGNRLASFFSKKIKYLKLLNKIQKNEMNNQDQNADLFWSHSRCRFIHYLGKGVLGISVENPKRKGDKTIPFYYTFWRVDGEYLGYLKCPHRIVDGHDGTLYYWIEELPKLKNGMYGNPMLVSVKVF